MEALALGLAVTLVVLAWFFFNTIKILKQYERGVIFTLGKVAQDGGVKGPGMIILIPGIQKMVRVSLRTVTMDVPAQDVITKDNVTVKVNAVVYFRVIDPKKAIIEVEDFYYATSLIAQTTLRSILGQNQFDDLLSNREAINAELQKVIDQQTEPWGVKVTTVEVRNVDLPAEMQRAIAIQAQAERERRAKIIHAEGELQASAKLGEAAAVISKNPIALQLRYLQTLTEIGTEKNTTIVFPLPIEFISAFQQTGGKERVLETSSALSVKKKGTEHMPVPFFMSCRYLLDLGYRNGLRRAVLNAGQAVDAFGHIHRLGLVAFKLEYGLRANVNAGAAPSHLFLSTVTMYMGLVPPSVKV